MKSVIRFIGVAALVLATVILSGCAHANDKSRSKHDMSVFGAVVPPGWTLAKPNITNSATGNQVADYTVVPSQASNQPSFWDDLVAPRPHTFLAYHETWTDESSGGGTFLLTDPTASALSFSRTNQNALGGSHSATVGEIQSVITTNAVGMVNAAGAVVGNVIGAAVSASTGSGAAVTAGANTASAISSQAKKALPVTGVLTNAP